MSRYLIILVGASWACTAASGAPVFYASDNPSIVQGPFLNALATQGFSHIATEDFEEGNIPDFTGIILSDPLVSGIPNVDELGRGFPMGLAAPDLRIQANPLGSGLNMIGEDTGGSMSKLASPAGSDPSLDIIFDSQNVFAASIFVQNPFSPGSTRPGDIRVYDTLGNEIGMVTVPTTERARSFVGVISDVPIGRINVLTYNLGFEPRGKEFVDDIAMYTPEPTTISLLAAGALMMMRRRKADGRLSPMWSWS